MGFYVTDVAKAYMYGTSEEIQEVKQQYNIDDEAWNKLTQGGAIAEAILGVPLLLVPFVGHLGCVALEADAAKHFVSAKFLEDESTTGLAGLVRGFFE